jgi:predicted transcriptional regulator of viral defense system
LVIGRIASASHGVVTRRELLDAGLTHEEIRQRIKRGTLLVVHRGVYRVGHLAPSRESTYLAAVKACGDGALLAGMAAAHLWGLLKGRPPAPVVFAATERQVPGVVVRRARRNTARGAGGSCSDRNGRLYLDDAVSCRGIPVTTVPRTLVDLASSLHSSALARACHEAGVLHGTTPAQVEAVLDRRPTSPGAATVRDILRGDARVTLSRLEDGFLERLRNAGLPLPQTNRLAGGRRVDCRWPERRLTVELDGYRYHHSRHAWEQDRRREREARARGDEFRRYTYGDVFEAPRLMLGELRALVPAIRPA